MVRMNSCRGHEYAPVFGAYASSGDEESSEGGSDCSEDPKAVVDSPEGSGDVELDPSDDVDGAFIDARDRWKIDGETLKGFYLHSATGQLFSWDQPRGLLYEYDRGSGDCVVVWAACNPQQNAEIWAVLPLPPTDPASLQSSQTVKSGDVLCMLHITRAEERVRGASADFCARLNLDVRATAALATLPPLGQAYVLKTFCAPDHDPSGALRRQVRSLKNMGVNVPWAGGIETATLRVPATGSILGRCVPEIAAMCWCDADPVAAAHCRIALIDGCFSVCDLGADEDGTLFDGRRLGSVWASLIDGCCLDLGPVRIRVELRPVKMAGQDLSVEVGAGIAGLGSSVTSSETASVRRPAPQRGSWRTAKRQRKETDDAETNGHVDSQVGSCATAVSWEYCGDSSASAVGAGYNSQLRSIPHSVRQARPEFGASPASPINGHLGAARSRLEAGAGLYDRAPTSAAPRAACRAPRGAGPAFWAAPRSPSPESPPDWVPRSPPNWIPRTPP